MTSFNVPLNSSLFPGDKDMLLSPNIQYEYVFFYCGSTI